MQVDLTIDQMKMLIDSATDYTMIGILGLSSTDDNWPLASIPFTQLTRISDDNRGVP